MVPRLERLQYRQERCLVPAVEILPQPIPALRQRLRAQWLSAFELLNSFEPVAIVAVDSCFADLALSNMCD
jgi:hypothetical protein